MSSPYMDLSSQGVVVGAPTASRGRKGHQRSHDDTLVRRIRVRRRHRDSLEVVDATTTQPWYEELWHSINTRL